MCRLDPNRIRRTKCKTGCEQKNLFGVDRWLLLFHFFQIFAWQFYGWVVEFRVRSQPHSSLPQTRTHTLMSMSPVSVMMTTFVFAFRLPPAEYRYSFSYSALAKLFTFNSRFCHVCSRHTVTVAQNRQFKENRHTVDNYCCYYYRIVVLSAPMTIEGYCRKLIYCLRAARVCVSVRFVSVRTAAEMK